MRLNLREYWKLGLVACLVAVLYADIVRKLVTDWGELPGYSHGFLIAPLALYIAWKQRHVVAQVPAAPDLRGLGLVFCACVVYLGGRLAADFFFPRVSLVLLGAGLVWAFWGLGRLKRLAFPFLLLASVIPLPVILYNQLAAPLQLLASRVATDLAQLAGVSVLRDGNIIYLANTSLGVAEACSGLHSLASLTVAGLLLGYLECTRTVTRVVLFLAAVPTAIFFNVMRVTITALLSEHNPEMASGFYHSVSGWLIFLAGFATLMLCGKLLRYWLEPGAGKGNA